jgi:hypothetical protein
MAVCSKDILGRRCAKQVVALGLQFAPADLAIGSWDGIAHRAPDAQADGAVRSRRPNGLARCADHGQTGQLSHVIACLSGSSDLGPAARRAVGRWWSGNGPRAALSNTILRPHGALVGAPAADAGQAAGAQDWAGSTRSGCPFQPSRATRAKNSAIASAAWLESKSHLGVPRSTLWRP